MSFESKPRRRAPIWLCLLALILLCIAAGAEARAETFNASVRICLKFDDEKGAPVKGAIVRRTGGRNEYLLEADKVQEGCYATKGIPFARGTAYKLEIDPKSEGYPAFVEPLNITDLQEGGLANPRPDGSVFVMKAGPLPNMAKRVRICLKDESQAPVKNAKVVLAVKGEGRRDPLPQETLAEGCYSSGELALDGAKSYELLITADSYDNSVQPLDLTKVQPGGALGPDPIVLKAIKRSGSWPTWLIVAGMAAPLVLLAGWLLFRKRQRNRGWTTPVPEAQTEFDRTPHPMEVVAAVQSLAVPLEGIRALLQSQTQLLEQIVGLLNTREQESRDEATRRAEAAAAERESRPREASVRGATQTEQDGERMARSFYADFLRGGQVSPDPIYLSVEGGSSMEDMLGPKAVVLEANPQGAMVLFRSTGDEEGGWVYPNTQRRFKEDALQKVFPDLNAEQFKYLQQTKNPNGCGVEPVPVFKIAASRWQVVSNR